MHAHTGIQRLIYIFIVAAMQRWDHSIINIHGHSTSITDISHYQYLAILF